MHMDRFLTLLSDRCSDGRVSGEQLLQMIYRTAAQMLNDRNVRMLNACSDIRELLQSVEQCKPVLVGELRGGGITSVFVDKEDKTGIKTARSLVDGVQDDDVLLIVSIDGPTPFCRKELPDSDRIQYFLAKELMCNITTHRLVPPHRALSSNEVAPTLERYAALPHQLPILLMTDPIRRYYNFPLGSIVEIQRRGLGQEASLYYRRVAA